MASVGHPPPHNPAGPPHAPPPAYFVDTKKGEVSELKALLKNISVEKDAKRKRDVIKKVIAYMTLGIDVSRLFTEMVMAIETRDLVVKKMVYLYLCNYAHDKPDLAIMCVNTLQRDCSSDDPMVRGLALRSLCSLRLPSMVEYISEPLRRSLTDPSAYVRKTGVMGILKLYHLAADMVKSSNMVDLLYNMIQDPDAQVIMNCILVLTEILADEGGMAINQALAMHVLSRVQDLNEWGVVQVLTLLTKYEPVSEDETFSLMNYLDPILRTTNSGVVLAAVKCFIHLTRNMHDLHPQVYARVKAPLLTLMAGGNPEVEYCILKHMEAMIHRCPGVFDDEYRQLYVRYNEPSYVKYEKIDILALIANDTSVNDIIAELSEYASDIDTEVSRRSICSIGKIAFRLPSAAPFISEKLIEFLDMEMNNVRPETVLVMKDLLRKYPNRRTDVLPALQRCLKKIDEAEAKAAVIWMIGEYGEELPNAPYILEPLVDMYGGLESSLVKMTLLTAIMKLFFKRPPEVQSMLGRLLSAAVNDFSSQDLHDRALLYYRLLTTDLNVARTVILGHKSKLIATDFAEERDTGLRDKLYAEFNTLSILYGKPSVQFVSPGYQFKVAAPQPSNADSSASTYQLPEDSLLSANGGAEGEGASPRVSSTGGYAGPSVDLLDLGAVSQALPSTSAGASSSFGLVEGVVMEPPSFQSLWAQLPECGTFNVQLQRLPKDTAELESALAGVKISALASGDLPDLLKFFLYAQDLDGDMYLVQALVHKAARRMDVTIKTEASATPTFDPAEALVEQISQALYPLGML